MTTLAEQAAEAATAVWADPAGRATTILTGILAALTALVYVIKKLREVVRWIVALARDIAAIKHEVKNNHTTNLREEADVRHDENRGTLATVDRKLDRVLFILGEHDDRLEELENTRDGKTDAH
jgi:molybdopterin-guanine dinucleotide biosynthesis protein A